MLASLMAGVALAAGPAPHVYFEQTTYVARDGRPPETGIVSRVWTTGRRMRLEVGPPELARPLILRLDDGSAYRLDPDRKTATAIDLDALRTHAHLDASTAGDLLGAAQDGVVRTIELDERRTIAGHACRGFRIRAPEAEIEIYVSADVGVGVEAFTALLEWSGAAQSLGPVLDEIRKLPGFPMRTHARIRVAGQVHETLSEVSAVRVETHDETLFEPPTGYRVVPAGAH